MMKVEFMKPFYTKITGDKLRLVFAFQYLTISKEGEIFDFIPIEGKEMIINLNTEQVENISEAFVFQKGNRFIRLPLYQLLLITNIHSFINAIIHNEKNNNLNKQEWKGYNNKIAKVNFKGLSDLPTSEKTYYFNTTITDLKINDLVLVDSQNKQQLANFLGYIDESEMNFKPTKSIIRKAETKVNSEKLNISFDAYESRKCEYGIPDKFKDETTKMLSEIMKFNKENLINKYLDDRNFGAINEVMELQF